MEIDATTTNYSVNISPPLNLSDRWSVGLLSLNTYYSIPNISATNNIFRYSSNGGTTWKTITLNVGSYQITDINSEITRLLTANGDTGIVIEANTFTLGSSILIPINYQVDFTVANSIASTLGFNATILTAGYYISPNLVNIMDVDTIIVNCSVIGNSYRNGTHQPIMYSFFPNVSPGYAIVEQPINVVYFPLVSNQINNINIWLTDQQNRAVDLRGQPIIYRLHFRYN
jgi:hypothetical protein